MADRYLYHLGANVAPYESYANAAERLQLFDVGVIATDLAVDETIWVQNGHSWTSTAAAIHTSSPNATPEHPQRLIAVTDADVNDPPQAPVTTRANYGREAMNANSILGFEGHWFIHGMVFENTTTSGSASRLTFGASTAMAHNITLSLCQLKTANNSNTNASVWLGNVAAALNKETRTTLQNCVFVPTHIGNTIMLGHGQHRFTGLSLGIFYATPTAIFKSQGNMVLNVLLENSDFSNSASAGVFDASGPIAGEFRVRNLKLHASTELCIGTIAAPGFLFAAEDVTIGASHMHFYRKCYAGEVFHEETIIPTNVADRVSRRNDGSEPYSRKIVAGNASYWNPMCIDWIHVNIEEADVAVNPYVEILVSGDGAAALTSRECWMEVDVMDAAGSVVATRHTSQAGLVDAGAALAAGTIAWDGHGYTTPRTHRLTLPASITPAQKGFLRIRVLLATNGTIYIGKIGR